MAFDVESGFRSELPPSVRPNQHEPNHLWGWVFDQHQVWVDRHGSEHEIDSMPLDYVRNVISFCELRAFRIRQLVEIDVLIDVVDLLIHRQRDASSARYAELADQRLPTDKDWLEQTPLLRALRRRLDTPGRRDQAQDDDDNGTGQAQ